MAEFMLMIVFKILLLMVLLVAAALGPIWFPLAAAVAAGCWENRAARYGLAMALVAAMLWA